MSIIQISQLTFAYEGSYDNIFENVSFHLDTDWRLGFTGRNGRGKTTFLKLLMGEFRYTGTVSSTVFFDYFPFEIKDKAQFTVDAVEEVCPGTEPWRLCRELSLLGVDEEVLYRPFETLSGGEQTKVLLAALFLKENNFLLIDEPTNHLDMEGREAVAQYLSGKRGFILVSHDRSFLDRCTDHTLYLAKTRVEICRGSYSVWAENRKKQEEYERAENQRLKKDIQRLDEAAKRTAAWSEKLEKTKKGTRNSGLRPDRGYIGSRAARMMQRSQNTIGNIERAKAEKENLLRDTEQSPNLAIHPLQYHSSRLVTLTDISVRYGDYTACRNMSFSVAQGERVALCGHNGCGKSGLLKLIMGENICYSGALETGSQLKISYVSQDTSDLYGSLKDYARMCEVDESLLKAILRKMDFSRLQFEKDMAAFSAGQKKKVLIARSLCEQAHLYIWDEPLNYVDLLSREQIETLILQYRPTMLFVEHDRTFTEKIATKVISFPKE